MADNMPADHVPAVNVPAENVPAEQVRNSGVFPPELWLKILRYVDKEDFRSLRLTNSVLHDLCDDPSIGWEKVSSFNIIILMCRNCNEQLTMGVLHSVLMYTCHHLSCGYVFW
jgi:F-box domain